MIVILRRQWALPQPKVELRAQIKGRLVNRL
jgi:hypothetical protein